MGASNRQGAAVGAGGRGLLGLSRNALIGIAAVFIVVLIVIAILARQPLASRLETMETYRDAFPIHVANPVVLKALVDNIAEFNPLGLADTSAIRASLLWQLKSQQGYAEFLGAENAAAVQVRTGEDGTQTAWAMSANVIPQILADAGVAADPAYVQAVSAEINRSGIYILDERRWILRDHEGTLQLVEEET